MIDPRLYPNAPNARVRTQYADREPGEELLLRSQRIARIGSWHLTMASGELYWSDETFRLVGASPGSFVPTVERFFSLVHTDDLPRLLKIREQALNEGYVHDVQFRITRADGELRHMHELAEVMVDEGGNVVALAGTIQDITERRAAEAELEAAEEMLRSSNERLVQALAVRRTLVNSLPANIALLDRNGVIIDVNEQWRRFAAENGYDDPDNGIGVDYLAVCDSAVGANVEEARSVAAGLRAVLAGSLEEFAHEYPCHRPGGPRWFRVMINPLAPDRAQGKHHGAVVMHIDITESVLAKQDLNRLAYEDRLTGVLSRAGFVQALSGRLEARGWEPEAALVMLNVRRQREINDVHGYAVGDAHLTGIAGRLRQLTGELGIVGRTGGNEFMVLLPGHTHADAAGARTLLVGAFEAPFYIEGATIESGASFGYTRFGQVPRGAESLVREVELALFESRHGELRENWGEYSVELDEQTRRRIQVTKDLRVALAENQFELHFQPQVELASGRLVSCEALIRWRHPEHGLQSPAMFIPIAERSQLIGPIGDWVINEACRCLREWMDAGLEVVSVAVNVSLVQFTLGDFTATVRSALAAHDVPPASLTLEITESVFERESGELLQQLHALHQLGVRLALDDFGTGYSSLLYLQKYPFDEIKVDQGFVADMLTDPYSHEIVRAVIGIAGGLGVEVVSEGIESEPVRDELVALGGRIGQGYYFSRPLGTDGFRSLLEKRSPLPLDKT